MKKIIPISIAVVSVLIIVLILIEKNNKLGIQTKEQPSSGEIKQEVTKKNIQNNKKKDEPTSVDDLIISSKKSEGTEKKYIDSMAGYQLDIPSSWKGYMTSRINHSQVAFGFVESNSGEFYDLMVLIEQPKNIYESNKEGSGLVYIGEVTKNKNVILCGGSCCKESFSGTYDFQSNRCKEVPEILKTFKAL